MKEKKEIQIEKIYSNFIIKNFISMKKISMLFLGLVVVCTPINRTKYSQIKKIRNGVLNFVSARDT